MANVKTHTTLTAKQNTVLRNIRALSYCFLSSLVNITSYIVNAYYLKKFALNVTLNFSN